MARRKENKLRPYRVDYFKIDEMKDTDKALLRSTVVRAVTSQGAANQLDAGKFDGIVLIRAYRYYKSLGQQKREVYKAVEDLFTANKAVKIMDQVEAYRKRKEIDAQFTAAYTTPQLSAPGDNGHVTRMSDSSLYDEVCTLCGRTDRNGDLDRPCPYASGPESPATKAVVADLAGMTAHDAHEQVMDTFVPNPGQPDINKFDLDAAAPVINPAPEHGDDIARALEGTAAIVYNREPVTLDPANCCVGAPEPPAEYKMPLWAKLSWLSGVLVVVVIIMLAILHHAK